MSHTRKRRSNEKRIPLITLYAAPISLRCTTCSDPTLLTCYGCGKPVCMRHNATRTIPHAVILCADCECAGMPILLCAC